MKEMFIMNSKESILFVAYQIWFSDEIIWIGEWEPEILYPQNNSDLDSENTSKEIGMGMSTMGDQMNKQGFKVKGMM